jgi:hypothetical protein
MHIQHLEGREQMRAYSNLITFLQEKQGGYPCFHRLDQHLLVSVLRASARLRSIELQENA